jgi:hypothetical protein
MTRSGTDAANSSPAEKLLEMVSGGWMSQALYVAAELRIADLLADGPKAADELAAATGADAGALRRLLRALTTIDICRQDAQGRFEMMPMGSLLRADAPDSLHAWTIWWGKYLWPVWERLLYSVQTGRSARQQALGTEGFEHLQQDSEAAQIFHTAAAELTRLNAAAIVRGYDFSSFARIVDVGGGNGELLACILRQSNNTRGVLFDLPHAIQQARIHLEAAGLAARCEFISGNFFESVPASGNAYILKSVLHDWNDEKCGLILGHCRRAMAGAGRLLLLEEMPPEHFTTSPAHQAIARGDLNMLVALAAQERTAPELRKLLAAVGFRVLQMIPVGQTFTLLEAAPEPSPVA